MSAPKFSPGPWSVESPSDGIPGRVSVLAQNGGVVMLYRSAMDEEFANARLIAAAPELYEAAEAAWNCIAELSPTQALVEVAQMLTAALAKARGEA